MILRAADWAAVADFWERYGMPLRILFIILIGVLLRWLLIVLLGRVVNQVVSGVKKNQKVADTKEMTQSPLLAARVVQRTRTLGSVGGNLITIVVGVVVIVMILDQLGFNLTAVLASAGIVAAGLAFGAQNIVKDLLNGLFMVFEDQLGVGDSVIIGDVSGTVESVGIRITQVRSIDGTLWFIRNGEILKLGNQSHDWGRALLDITVASDTDLEAATAAILDAARGVIRSREHARQILSTPEVWGLESVFADRATLRLTVKTRPDTQWGVTRALRAAIKDRFDELGIRLAPESAIAVLQTGYDVWQPTPAEQPDPAAGPGAAPAAGAAPSPDPEEKAVPRP